jgi:hypothetical protein
VLMAVSVAVGVWRNADFHWPKVWFGVVAALFALYWVLPIGYRQGWDIDVRVLPILYLVILGVVRVGHRARWLAATAVLAFLIHAGETAYYFVAEQPRLASLATSFAIIPTNARILPIVEPEPHSITQSYIHFWAYGMIRRGWLSAYLFTIPGVQPLRLRDVPYTPVLDPTVKSKEPLDWTLVRDTYDYVWAYNVPRLSRELAAIGQLILSKERLEAYCMLKPSARVP